MPIGSLATEGDLQRWLQDQLTTMGLTQPGRGLQAGTVAKAALGTDALNAFLKLAVPADRKAAFGTQNLTWTASTVSGVATVTHGLGTTPAIVLCTARGLGTAAVFFATGNIGATTFQMQGQVPSNLSATLGCDWLVVG